MEKVELNACIERTDQKLRFARILLDLFTETYQGHGAEIERALWESFLYHLLGVRDAFFQELNIYYGLNLSMRKVHTRQLID